MRHGVVRAEAAPGGTPPDGRPHFAPKAKSVIWLFMIGGTSHVESFDPKPELTKYGGKTGEHSFALAVTTKAITPFDAIKQVIIPGPPRVPVTPKRGSWSVSYTFRQYLVERGNRDGWGFFTQLSTAGRDTSPITAFVNFGLGGNGLIKSRRNDEFGIEYAYTGVSEVLKNNLDPLNLRRLRPEHQVEMFYNLHITRWLRRTGDLQIIRPTRPVATTAVIPACASR